jgi:hypothetical protein
MSEGAKIVALPGVVIDGDETPVDNVIEMLEEYLEAAKRGEVRAVIIGSVNSGNVITTMMEGEASANNLMLCALAVYEGMKSTWLGGCEVYRRE